MKKILCAVMALLIFTLALCGCSTKSNSVTDEMFALDTIIRFTLYDEDTQRCHELINECKAEITRLENMLSATKEDSDIYRLNNANGEKITVSDETAELLRKTCELCKSTDGAFDISIRPLTSLWGFDDKNYSVPSDDEIEKMLCYVSYEDITIDGNEAVIGENMAIDLGGVAKGYIGDKVREILNGSFVYSALVDMGGMIITKGEAKSPDEKFFTIGLQYPDDSGECFLTFKNSSPAISTSGGYQRYFEENSVRYHHIIDSKSGKPANSGLSSVTVVGYEGYVCDALSTAFFVMGVDKTVAYLNTHKDTEGNRSMVIMLSDDRKTLYVSKEFDTYDLGLELLDGYKDIEIVYI